MLVSAGLLTLLAHRRRWVMVLAVGIWLPILYIRRSREWWVLVPLLIPLVGAHAGWAVNLGLRKVFDPAQPRARGKGAPSGDILQLINIHQASETGLPGCGVRYAHATLFRCAAS